MTRHTILITLHNRPGAMSRTMTQLDIGGVAFATLSVGRSAARDALRVTLAVAANHAAHAVQQLGQMVDVIEATDMSATMRSRGTPSTMQGGDFREQADGAPHDVAA